MDGRCSSWRRTVSTSDYATKSKINIAAAMPSSISETKTRLPLWGIPTLRPTTIAPNGRNSRARALASRYIDIRAKFRCVEILLPTPQNHRSSKSKRAQGGGCDGSLNYRPSFDTGAFRRDQSAPPPTPPARNQSCLRARNRRGAHTGQMAIAILPAVGNCSADR